MNLFPTDPRMTNTDKVVQPKDTPQHRKNGGRMLAHTRTVKRVLAKLKQPAKLRWW